MFHRITSRNLLSPRRQERKEIQKSPFLTKGERGGFEERWRALRSFDFVQDRLLHDSSLFRVYKFIFYNFKICLAKFPIIAGFRFGIRGD